jgi:hypothetical protein
LRKRKIALFSVADFFATDCIAPHHNPPAFSPQEATFALGARNYSILLTLLFLSILRKKKALLS